MQFHVDTYWNSLKYQWQLSLNIIFECFFSSLPIFFSCKITVLRNEWVKKLSVIKHRTSYKHTICHLLLIDGKAYVLCTISNTQKHFCYREYVFVEGFFSSVILPEFIYLKVIYDHMYISPITFGRLSSIFNFLNQHVQPVFKWASTVARTGSCFGFNTQVRSQVTHRITELERWPQRSSKSHL